MQSYNCYSITIFLKTIQRNQCTIKNNFFQINTIIPIAYIDLKQKFSNISQIKLLR
jgi:hypothetical protein